MTAPTKRIGAPRRERCVRGHDLNDPRNTRLNTAGFRYCIACNRIVAKEWRERKAAEQLSEARV